MSTQAEKNASLKYAKANVKQVVLALNKKTDIDIIEKLNNVSNKTGYIKELIRNDIKGR